MAFISPPTIFPSLSLHTVVLGSLLQTFWHLDKTLYFHSLHCRFASFELFVLHSPSSFARDMCTSLRAVLKSSMVVVVVLCNILVRLSLRISMAILHSSLHHSLWFSFVLYPSTFSAAFSHYDRSSAIHFPSLHLVGLGSLVRASLHLLYSPRLFPQFAVCDISIIFLASHSAWNKDSGSIFYSKDIMVRITIRVTRSTRD
jgi:hypothetical protein